MLRRFCSAVADLLLFSDTDSISLPSCAMFVLGVGVGQVQERFHDCPVLDEESINISRSSPASLLTSKEYDGFSTPRILRLLVIFIFIWGSD